MKITAVIPTYNERENIKKLIPQIMKEVSKLPHEFRILIVDDNSPDGTGEVVKEMQHDHKNLYIIQGKKEGLGKAYIRGMTYAIETLNADAVMEMDADFSHNPVDVPRLIKELDNSDFVIGSRYVPGGKIPKDWSLFRKLNSRLGNICARYAGGMQKIKDCTSGFRAIRSSLLKKVNINTINVGGYCFQISLLYRAILKGARIQEIPIEFIDRAEGTSKLGLKDILEFLYYVFLIRFEKINSQDTI